MLKLFRRLYDDYKWRNSFNERDEKGWTLKSNLERIYINEVIKPQEILVKEKIFVTLPATKSSDSSLYVKPRGLLRIDVKLHPEAYKAIIEASLKLKALSKDRYILVVTRGYVHWGLFKHLKGKIGKVIFSILFPEDKCQSQSIFSSNGHDDGLSVDVILYDLQQQQFLQFLTWKNVFISRKAASDLLRIYNEPINLLNEAMVFARFQGHDDPREKLQVHFRLIQK